MSGSAQYTVFVRDLCDHTICLTVSADDTLAEMREQLQERTCIPVEAQLLLPLEDDEASCTLGSLGIGPDTPLQLSGRLRGGKGGFGSLLRGSRKTSQTDNEDACRDLSGRRIRVATAQQKLQEWAAGEEKRKQEKQAAREEKERAKAERRTELAQVNTDAIRKEQSAALASMEKALQSSVSAGAKRSAAAAQRPPAKKPRFESDDDSEDESDSDVDSEAEGVSGPGIQGLQGSKMLQASA